MSKIDRRVFASGTTAAAFSIPLRQQSAQAQEPDGYTTTLRRMISEVVQDGNVDQLDAMVTPDIVAPDLELSGIEAFRQASIDADASRRESYARFEFAIQSAASSVEDGKQWAIAYIRFQGETNAGKAFDVPGFYAVAFTNDLISEVYGSIDVAMFMKQTQ